MTGRPSPPQTTGPLSAAGLWRPAAVTDPLAPTASHPHGNHPLVGLTLTDAHRHVAAIRPDHLGVVCVDEALTHGQLVDHATVVARHLRDVMARSQPDVARRVGGLPAGVVGVDATGTPVGTPTYVLCGHDTSVVVAMMGVAAAGGTHLVLDHRAPAAHRGDIVARHGPGPVVCSPAHVTEARKLAASPDAVVVVDPDAARTTGAAGATGESAGDSAGDSTQRVTVWDVDSESPLAVSSTSGTSGTPKAVVHSHATMVANAVRFAAAADIGPDDRVVVSLPFAFVAAGTPTHAALLSGATAVVADPGVSGATGVAHAARHHAATVVFLTAGLIDNLGRHDTQEVPSVRLVVTGGDQLDTRALGVVARWFPNATVLHRYNTSETLWVTGVVVNPAAQHTAANLQRGPMPIGWPVPWCGATIADSGELVVTGDTLALGYLNDPDRTTGRFGVGPDGRRSYATGDLVDIDDTGCLWHRGRLDTTVKVAGTLVDPVAVEHAMVGITGVETAAVAAVTDTDGRTRLDAWVVAPHLTGRMVRRAVVDRLPFAMVPTTVTMVNNLPLTAMGKVDRHALTVTATNLTATVGAGGPPDTGPEQLVAAVMGEVLALDGVGRHDDVFTLGADSLDAIEICTRLEALSIGPRRQRAVGMSDLIDHPSPATMAALLTDSGPDHTHHPRLRRVAPGDRSLPPVVLFSGGGGGHVLGMSQLGRAIDAGEVWGVLPRGFATRARPDRTIETQAATVVADITERLGTRPVNLVAYSAGGVVAAEVARQLIASGNPPAAVVLINSLLPSDAERRYRSANVFRRRVIKARKDAGRTITAAHRLWWRIDPVRRVARERWMRATAGVVVRRQPRQHRIFTSISWNAIRRHQPGPLRCDVTLIRASVDAESFARASHDLHWSEVVEGTLDIVVVPGTHRDLVKAQMPRTAAVISEALKGSR